MRDIANKQITLRTAKGMAVVLCQATTLERIKSSNLPKGDLLNTGRAAGFLAAKNTHNLIPHCHPVAIEGFKIEYAYLEPNQPTPLGTETLQGSYGVVIYGEGKSIGRTGIEMEVLTGISVTALVLYDLLKPIDKQVEITSIKLLDKTGGKSDREQFYKNKTLTAAILVYSEAVANGLKEDEAGVLTQEKLQSFGVTIVDYKVVTESGKLVQHWVTEWEHQGVDFIFTVGGIASNQKENLADTLEKCFDKKLEGIIALLHQHAAPRAPLVSVLQTTAGRIGRTTVVALPDSSEIVTPCLDGILPNIFQILTNEKG